MMPRFSIDGMYRLMLYFVGTASLVLVVVPGGVSRELAHVHVAVAAVCLGVARLLGRP